MNIKQYIPVPKSLLLKLSSLILGYCVWYALSSNTTVEQTVTIPLYCYNQKDNHTIQAPENIVLTLKAPRSYMRLIDHNVLAAQEIAVSHYAPVRVIDTRT